MDTPDQPRLPLSRRRFLALAAGAAIAGLPALPARAGTPGGVPGALMAGLRDDPAGLGSATPRLWWQVPVLPGADGGKQLAYQIQLTRDPRGFVPGAAVESTGWVTSDASTAAVWPFPALAPRSVAYWRVRTRNGPGPGRETAWSAAQRLVLGPVVDADWGGAVSVWAPPVAVPSYGEAVFAADVQIRQLRAGFFVRMSSDLRNGYMWQLVAGSPGVIRPHVVRNGAYTLLAEVPLAVPIPTDRAFRLEIRADGPTIRTSVDGQVVHELTGLDDGPGAFGVRTGSTESFWVDNVTVTDLAGAVLYHTDFSEPADKPSFGILDSGRLLVGASQAGLLGVPGPDDWALLRHEFDLPAGTVIGAYLHASAQSPVGARQHVYRAWCNGQHIGVGPSRSADAPRYSTHDVTDLVRPGTTNALGFWCWTRSDKRLQALLDVYYADGHTATVVSGPDWRARTGGKLLPWTGDLATPYYMAPNEAYDARHEPVGWREPGYRGDDFVAARSGAPIAGLVPAGTTGIARVERRPASVVQLSPGQWLVDTGREITGGLRLALDAPAGTAGTTVDLRLGEERNADGTVRYQLRAQTTYHETWTLRDGRQTIEHWGYRCFRSAELRTDPGLDLSGAITLLEHVVPQPEQVGTFSSANPDLDKVWGLCAYTIAANRADLHMDSPTRERDAYEGDLIVHGRGEMALSRSYDIVRHTARYLVRRPTWPTEYKFMPITTAWEEYLETGDPDSLAADLDLHAAEQGERWLDADGLIRKNPGAASQNNGDIVDWPTSQRDGYVFAQVNTVVNAWQYQAFVRLEQAARVVGRPDLADHYRSLHERMRAALNATFYDPATGSYTDGEGTDHRAQHATVYAAGHGVAADAELPKIANWLASDPDHPVRVSANTVQWLLEVLFRGGRADAALSIMTSRRAESWLSMMEVWGATQTMEAWSPTVKPNTTFSHPWTSGPANVIARYLLGVRVAEAGAARIEVAPQPAGLAWARGVVPTVRGPVTVEIEQSPGYRVVVEVPGNTTGTLTWPLRGNTAEDFDVVLPPGAGPRQTVDGDHFLVPLRPGRTEVTLSA
jgi:alpha-L-rhamnosidase